MPRPQPQPDPIKAAIKSWISTIQPPQDADIESWQQTLLDGAPSRFSVYEPMVLLPAGSFTSPPWTSELIRHDQPTISSLWSHILQELSKNGRAGNKGQLSHLAANEGIPLQNKDGSGENVRRSPVGLRMFYGDFGPGQTNDPPAQEDFAKAFWVTTKQNGITQTWAPRWTMFSRGNVKEKARLLKYPKAKAVKRDKNKRGKSRHQERQQQPQSPSPDTETHDTWAVDLYAGIGYFTFCYVSLGMRVLCWEINPWSVEALRRGADLNRWRAAIINDEDYSMPLPDLMAVDAQIVIFPEDNQKSHHRIKNMQRHGGPSAWARDIRHVNCGFLPTSEPTWGIACSITRAATMLSTGGESWLHLHENVADADIKDRAEEVKRILGGYESEKLNDRAMTVTVEKVKTFAPGVWHCVFDVHITKKNSKHIE